jgi:parallel beta-helix repeat protein
MRFVFLICILIFFQVDPLYSQRIFVDQNITDSSCRTYNPSNRDCIHGAFNAFRSLQQAIENASHGDTICVREGFFRDTINLTLNKDNPGYLTIMNYNDESVVIDGNNPDMGPMIKIGSDRIIIQGLIIMHSNTFGIYSINTNDVTIKNCEVAYSNDGGIVFVDASEIKISHCHVHHNNYRGLKAAHEGISMHKVNTFVVHDCVVHDNKEEGIDAKYGSKYGKIYNNLVYRNNGPNIYIDKANLIDVYNNIIHSAVAKAGISLNIESRWHTEGLPWTLQYVNIYNNVIYNNSGGIGFWLEPGDGEETQALWDHINIINNTIVGNAREGESRGGGIYILNPEPANFGDSIVIRNNIITGNINEISKNIWDRYGKGQADKFIIDHNLFVEDEASDYFGEDPILTDDPGYVDHKDADYRLAPHSHAINTGSSAGAPSSDIRGYGRPQGGKVDIGAYEHR